MLGLFCKYKSSLKDLLSRLKGVAFVIGADEDPPPFDCQCPLLSVPLELKATLRSLPKTEHYLAASQERVAKWDSRLSRSGKKRVAICWAGSPSFIDDHNRSIGLERFSPLLAAPDIEFFSIQKVLRPDDNEILNRHPQVVHLGSEIVDFDDTAAIMSLMDLVVSSDTSVVHLAGALGVPTWILLQYAADWRWLPDREDSPWYASVRLFRQPTIGDWSTVVRRVSNELERLTLPSSA